MKASDKPQISKKWWTSDKPADITGAELGEALAMTDKALAEVKKSAAKPAIETALTALTELESAIDETIKKECDNKKHKDVITVLNKFFPLIKEEKGRLEKLLEGMDEEGEEDEEESDDKIFETDYLIKMIKLLKSTGKELNFGFGLDKNNPEGSTLLLTRTGKPERLFRALKKKGDFANRLITYGKAVPDAENSKVLVFKLAESAGEPPQVIKLGRRFLRSDKALKFRKLRLILPDGGTFDDPDPDPEEEQSNPAQTQAKKGPSKSVLSDDKLKKENIVRSEQVRRTGQMPRDLTKDERDVALKIRDVLDAVNSGKLNLSQALDVFRKSPALRLKEEMNGEYLGYHEVTLAGRDAAGGVGSIMRLLFKVDKSTGKVFGAMIVQMHPHPK